MAKITGPLMSLDASGSVASTITFSKWKGRNYVRQLVKPSNPKSPAQTAFRAMFGFLSSVWKTLGGTEQGSWTTQAAATNVSPFNAFTQDNQRRWTQIQAPGQSYPVGTTGTPSVLSTVVATGGVRQIQLAMHLAAAAQQWGVIIYRNTMMGFTPSQNDVIAVMAAASNAVTTYIDSGLTPGMYFYRFATFSKDGNAVTDATEYSETAT